MNYKYKSLLSLIITISIIFIGQLIQIQNTNFTNLFIILLIVSWISLIYFSLRAIFSWYRSDLAERTIAEMNRQENMSDEEIENEEDSWIPKLF